MVDCEVGRRMGCKTFCCRLLVRLTDEEARSLYGEDTLKRFVDKDSEGYCVHFNRHTHKCKIWASRPSVCREYECNSDFLLQIALRNDFNSITELIKTSRIAYIPKECYQYIPLIKRIEK
jgi:Fe-S-cluster containining protein